GEAVRADARRWRAALLLHVGRRVRGRVRAARSGGARQGGHRGDDDRAGDRHGGPAGRARAGGVPPLRLPAGVRAVRGGAATQEEGRGARAAPAPAGAEMTEGRFTSSPPTSRPLADGEARRRIREDLDTTFVVEAAAGTGKTTELVSRIVA